MTDKKDFADNIRQKLEDWDYQLDRLTARLGDKREAVSYTHLTLPTTPYV